MAEPTVDNYGNFQTSPGPQPPTSEPTSNALGNLTGSGSPEGVVSASPGGGYVDTDDGTLYVKVTGVGSTGWMAVSGGGGSGVVYNSSGNGTPEGVVSGAPGRTYWDALNSVFYVKKTGTGNTGWQNLVGV